MILFWKSEFTTVHSVERLQSTLSFYNYCMPVPGHVSRFASSMSEKIKWETCLWRRGEHGETEEDKGGRLSHHHFCPIPSLLPVALVTWCQCSLCQLLRGLWAFAQCVWSSATFEVERLRLIVCLMSND